MKVKITAILALLFPLLGRAAEHDIREVATRVAVAYATDDLATLRTLWSAQQSTAARVVESEVEQTARIECHELKGVIIDSAGGTGDSNSVRATIVRSPSPKHLLMTFRREGDQWHLAELVLAERAAAKEVVTDPARWDALVSGQPELLDRDLAVELSSFASLGAAAAKEAEARAATARLKELAALRGDAATRSLAATAEAVVAEAANDVEGAAARSAEAVVLARHSGDVEAMLRALAIQSRAHERTPNGMAHALAAMEEALPLADRVTNRRLAAFILGNSGNLQLKQGNYAEALTYLYRSAAISKEIGDLPGMMKVESLVGQLLQIQGDNELAVVHMLRANELAGGDPANDAWRGQNFIQLALSYTELGRERESMEALRNAEELGRRSQSPVVIGHAHRLLGSSYRRARDYAAATRELEQALSVFETAKRVRLIPAVLQELAFTRLDAGDPRGALEIADRCAATSLDMEEAMHFINCRTVSGEAHRALGESDAALADLRAAIDFSEERRRTLVGDARQRAHFLEEVISPYLEAADILADRGEVAAALELTELARSRSLLDVISRNVAHQPSVLTPDEVRRNEELALRIAALNRRLRNEKNKEAAEQLTREIAAARTDYESYQLVLDAVHPRRMALQGSVPLAKPEDVLTLLGPAAAILEYVVSGDRVRAFVITSQGGAPRLQSFRLHVGGSDLDALVGRFGDALAHEDLAYRKDARTLYTQLLAPLERELRGKRTLCIVPHGSLWRLPFEALLDARGRFVAESYICFYAPSMSVLAQVARRAERRDVPNTLLAVGQPAVQGAAAARLRGEGRDLSLGPIKEAEEEVRALRALYGAARSRVYIGDSATKETVMPSMESSRVLHFATHAIFDEKNPMYSVVVLAESPDLHDDGLLAAWEIMRLNLRADVAVLSACETARGSASAGEGLIGFTWALFVAGCPSSVVSHWKVDSASTKTLMVAFHRALLRGDAGDQGTAEALRAAKLSLLRDPATRHPFYWAPFVLVGSPRISR